MTFDPQKWGPFVVVLSLLALMWFVSIIAVFHGLPENAQSNLIVGAVITGFATGYGFYLSSNSSSKSKDATIQSQAAALSGGGPPPPPGTTTTIVTPPTPPAPAPVAVPVVATVIEASASEPTETSQS